MYSRRTAEDWRRDILREAEAKTLPRIRRGRYATITAPFSKTCKRIRNRSTRTGSCIRGGSSGCG
jgi:hypothetical protein